MIRATLAAVLLTAATVATPVTLAYAATEYQVCVAVVDQNGDVWLTDCDTYTTEGTDTGARHYVDSENYR